jgi:multidrug efflux system outer membrane protein
VQAKAVASATRATTLSNSRYRNGMVSQLDLLDARRQELQNRRQALQVKSAQYQATVGLIRAIGGSWQTRPVADNATGGAQVAVTQLRNPE